MMRLFALTLLVCAFLLGPAQADTLRVMKNTAFKPGEKLVYRVHYGFVNAGEASFEVKESMETVAGRSCYKIVGIGRSTGTFDFFFKVRDYYESHMDEQALLPHRFVRIVNEGGYKFDDHVAFYHQRKTAVSKKGTYTVTENIQDVLSSLYYARNLDFTNAKYNQKFNIDVFLDDQVYHGGVIFKGRETVDTDMGKFKCIKLVPLLITGNVFKTEEGMTLWVTDDANRIPVRIESEILVGSIKADLKSYTNLRNPVTSKVK